MRYQVKLKKYVVEELRNYKVIQNKNYNEDIDLVIVNDIGKPLHPRSLSGSYGNLIKKLNWDRIRFHDLRHVHATLLLKIGEHPKVVAKRLGHSNTKMTMDIYSQVTSNMLKDLLFGLKSSYKGIIVFWKVQ
ncbi:tyrosine-type recombinase/integrase [Paenibacillus jilunlii]|uniref:Tyr recombinase domain-containing protein n=1 Tax=Paenibacillus jilunlii TaxID=682956 RepID=A0ABR5SS34_9BACL|nr:site-specific integrase [Paenibacillus jilunlii]KWX73545.1 hypothetical protein AML91_17885 [Paenibacillus jilunlii]